MAVSMLDNLSIKKKAPNVDRDLFKTLAEMAAYSENYLPDVFECNVVEDGKRYRFNRNNPTIPIYGKWREVLGSESQNMEQVVKNQQDIEMLKGDSSVEGSVDSKTSAVLEESKAYTDEQISKMSQADAIVCDSKPTRIDRTTSYIKDGITLTTEIEDIWFYYEEDGKLLQTIWIDGSEITIVSAGSIDFSEYVSKLYDVVGDFSGDEAEVSKIPNLAALKAFEARINNKLSEKVAGDAIVDDLLSDNPNAPLSAKQGRQLNEYIGAKLDSKFAGEDSANKILGTDNEGKVVIKSLDSAIDASSENVVKNKAIAVALEGKLDTQQDPSMAGRVPMVNDDGNVVFVSPTATSGNTADMVAYNHEVVPEVGSVADMLDLVVDKMFYEGVKITKMEFITALTGNPLWTEVEHGYMFHAWTPAIRIEVNKPYNKLQSITITNGTEMGIIGENLTYEVPYDITGPTTFTVTVSDGKTTSSRSLSIKFGKRMMWGTYNAELNKDPDEYNSLLSLGNQNQKLVFSEEDVKGTYEFDVAEGQFIYIAAPNQYLDLIRTVNIGGFDTDMYLWTYKHLPSSFEPSVTYPMEVVRSIRGGLGKVKLIIG